MHCSTWGHKEFNMADWTAATNDNTELEWLDEEGLQGDWLESRLQCSTEQRGTIWDKGSKSGDGHIQDDTESLYVFWSL